MKTHTFHLELVVQANESREEIAAVLENVIEWSTAREAIETGLDSAFKPTENGISVLSLFIEEDE